MKTVKKQEVTTVEKIEVKPDFGFLKKVNDESSLLDFKGEIKLEQPGEYWLKAFAKKDDTGLIVLELEATYRDKIVEAKDADRGVLFRNNRKRMKFQPDYTGSIFVEAPGKFSLFGVIEESKTGIKYLAIQVGEENEDIINFEELPF